jgi:tetratricopeptide (TPR) repeat protein
MANDKNILLDSDVYNAGLEQFKGNLSDILSLIKDKNVDVIVGRLVSNLRDKKPFIPAETPGYSNADQVYEEAWENYDRDNYKKADSLFRLAKDLDVLRFRAPEKINTIIDDLGNEFNVTIAPIDTMFNLESPGGIVGGNLVVDHLHPNVEGYQLIGKTFYDCMQQKNYLPKTEEAKIPFEKQDSLTKQNFVFTKLDSVIGNYNITVLKHNWPYVKNSLRMKDFMRKDFLSLFKPQNLTDSLAMYKIEGMSWTDIHLLAAQTYLRKDDIKNYLVHMNTLLYQFPVLKDYNTVLTYFYNQKKIDLSDYTSKRVGIIELHIGKYDDAVKHLSDAYNTDPQDPQILYNLSLSYFKKNNLKAASAYINKCLDIDQNYPNAKDLHLEIKSESNK